MMSVDYLWNGTDRRKKSTLRKTCPSATLSTINLTWTDLGSNPGLRGERPATNRLSLTTAYSKMQINLNYIWSFSSYRAVNTPRRSYKNHSVDV